MKRIWAVVVLVLLLVGCGPTPVAEREEALETFYLYADTKNFGMVCVEGNEVRYYFDGEAVNLENNSGLDVMVHSRQYVVSTHLIENLDDQCKVRIK